MTGGEIVSSPIGKSRWPFGVEGNSHLPTLPFRGSATGSNAAIGLGPADVWYLVPVKDAITGLDTKSHVGDEPAVDVHDFAIASEMPIATRKNTFIFSIACSDLGR
jgi:hypothetical protein